MYSAVVFLPLLGAIVAGLFGRSLGDRASQWITSGLLIVSAVLAIVILYIVGFSDDAARRHHRGLDLGPVGLARCLLGAALRHADRGHAVRRHRRVGSGARLFDRLHAPRSEHPALLRLSEPLHLRHADAGDGGQLPAAVLRLGGRRPVLLSADRLLVRPAVGQCRRDQGVPRQPRRRYRLRARHRRRLRAVRLGAVRRRPRRWPRTRPTSCGTSSAWT